MKYGRFCNKILWIRTFVANGVGEVKVGRGSRKSWVFCKVMRNWSGLLHIEIQDLVRGRQEWQINKDEIYIHNGKGVPVF
jgi:hypothetical protein